MGIFKCKERLYEATVCFRKAVGKDFERLLGDERENLDEQSSDTEENSDYENEEDPREDDFVVDSVINSIV